MLDSLGRATPEQEPLQPAVSIRRSVQQDYIVCLDCSFRAQTLCRRRRPHRAQVSRKGGLLGGLGIGDVGNVVLRDRHLLSRDGFVVVVVAVDADTGQIVSGPDIITRGFVYIREAGSLIEDAEATVCAALEGGGPDTRTKIKDSLAEFLYLQTKRRPMILPVVMEM